MGYTSALLIALGMALPVLAEGPAAQFTQVTDTRLISFSPGGTIRIVKSYGDLYIEGWDRAEVEMIVIKSTHYFAPAVKDEAKERMRAITVEAARRSDTELAIETGTSKNPSRSLPHSTRSSVTMECRIHVPRDVRLMINHRGGSVLVSNVTGDVEADDREGDIMLMLPAGGTYSIDATSKMGHIASDFEGRTRNRYIIGQRFVSANSPGARRIHLCVGFGGVTILALPPEGEALATAGDASNAGEKYK
jgi:hypothetical protein